MSNTINLDQIIRKYDGQTPIVAGEQVLVTIDLASKKEIEKTLLVRLGGNYRDYLVANNQNPTRTASGQLSTYYVHDAQNKRTLALEIGISVYYPVGNEVKVAEALHDGEQTPTQTFAFLLQRWVREFIPLGDESRFIDNYDAARLQLEKHIAARASNQTGLKLSATVTLSGKASVPDEIIVGPVEIGVRFHDYKEKRTITVEAGLAIDSQHYVKAFVFQENQASPEELFKRHLRDYFFDHVKYEQFMLEHQYPHFKQPLQRSLSAALQQVGRRVSFINFPISGEDDTKEDPEFFPVSYPYSHELLGRSESIVIQNIVQLYRENSVAFLNSGITDLENWVKSSLDVILQRNLIGKTYVDLLLRFSPLEQNIKRELSARATLIGYKVNHLVAIPDLKEKELTEPFSLETEGDFQTGLEDFKVQVKFSIKLRIQNLQSIEKYLNQGTDVKEAIKDAVLKETQYCLNKVHPERFYLYFYRPNEDKTANLTADERLAVKDLLSKKIAERLQRDFDAEILDLMPSVGRTDLTERFNNLRHVIREFSVSIEPPDPQATELLILTGNFEVRGVYNDSDGWKRFSAMRLDLNDLQTQLEKHLKAELKTYYQSIFMFQNRMGRQQVFTLVRDYARIYMRREFGLIIHVTNLDRNITQAEERQRQLLLDIENRKLTAASEQAEQLISNLKELRKRRVKLLSISPIDKEALQEIDENIQLLEAELEAITSARFGQHRLAATLEAERPDELPDMSEAEHVAVQYELEVRPKGQLTE